MSNEMMSQMMSCAFVWPFCLVLMLIVAVIIIVPFWVIFKKSGHSKWLSLLMVVPIINILVLYFLAFSRWPSISQSG